MLTAPFEPRREEGFDNVTSMTTRSLNPVPPPSVGLVDAPQCVSAKGETAVVGPVEIVVVIVQALVGVLENDRIFNTFLCQNGVHNSRIRSLCIAGACISRASSCCGTSGLE